MKDKTKKIATSGVEKKQPLLSAKGPKKENSKELEQYENVEKASQDLSEGTYTGTAPASHRRV
jgi:hypothetical protein